MYPSDISFHFWYITQSTSNATDSKWLNQNISLWVFSWLFSRYDHDGTCCRMPVFRAMYNANSMGYVAYVSPVSSTSMQANFRDKISKSIHRKSISHILFSRLYFIAGIIHNANCYIRALFLFINLHSTRKKISPSFLWFELSEFVIIEIDSNQQIISFASTRVLFN